MGKVKQAKTAEQIEEHVWRALEEAQTAFGRDADIKVTLTITVSRLRGAVSAYQLDVEHPRNDGSDLVERDEHWQGALSRMRGKYAEARLKLDEGSR